MKVLFVSNDPAIFDAASVARKRMHAYAGVLGELHVLSAAPRGARAERDGALRLYPVIGSRLFRLPRLALLARALVRKAGIEVVSAQDPFEYGLVALLARGNAALHVQLHTDPFAPAFPQLSLANRMRLSIMPFVIRHAKRLRVVSPWLQKSLVAREAIAPERVAILPIYTDLARFRALRRAPEHGQLLWVGRFEREKDPMLALEALAAARAAGTDARLTMLGTGRLLKAVKARAKARGLTPYLDLPGRADPVPYLAKAELLLATSRYEGYGLAIVEALAAGVPVLSKDVGIAREAGAVIAPGREFPKRAAELLTEGPPAPPPVRDPYPSFDAYVEAYAKNIQDCVHGSLAGHTMQSHG